MDESFGKILRAVRHSSGVGLRELAVIIKKSPGYLSDIEQERVPPPSEEMIIAIANALSFDKNVLLKAAKKMDPELTDYVAEHPHVADFLRLAKNQEFDEEDWQRIDQLVKISKIGKEDKDKA